MNGINPTPHSSMEHKQGTYFSAAVVKLLRTTVKDKSNVCSWFKVGMVCEGIKVLVHLLGCHLNAVQVVSETD